jgi:uncharacterized lipoprotein YajG
MPRRPPLNLLQKGTPMSLSPRRVYRWMHTTPPAGSSSPTIATRMASAIPLALLLLTGGCAFIDLNVAPPPAQSLAQPATLGRGREVILQAPFTDQRSEPERCGMQKNGYNMATASVHCAVPPPQWLSQALEQGLVSAGFRVRRSHLEAQQASSVRIDGTVLQFFVEPDVGLFTFTPEADISVRLVLTSRSGLRAKRVFYVKGVESSLVGTEENFQAAAHEGTRQVVTAMVSAIAALLDRYPHSGAPDVPSKAVASLLSGKEAGR